MSDVRSNYSTRNIIFKFNSKFKKSLILLISSHLFGCTLVGSNQNSILVVAIEGLSFNQINCNSGLAISEGSGIHSLCNEFVKFTHAYTPSPLTVPAIASVLTGKYPFEHGCWDNGKTYLKSNQRSVAEVATRKGWRSSFFSGGPPVLRRSGLNQGFERFIDRYQPHLNQIFNPSSTIVEQFFEWLQKDVRREPFFTFMYFPDLVLSGSKYITNPEKDLVISQLTPIDGSIAKLFDELKKKKIWNKTSIFVFGVNGPGKRIRPSEIKGNNLYAENTRVALFVKPSGKKRDKELNWKVDKNVSLVDIGVTLFDFIFDPLPESKNKALQTVSLKQTLSGAHPNWKNRRPILIESAFPLWKEKGETRFALIIENFFVLLEEKINIFNNLIDRFQITPLGEGDPTWKEISEMSLGIFQRLGFSAGKPLESHKIQKYNLARKIWGDDSNIEAIMEDLERYLSNVKDDKEVQMWKAYFALKNENWDKLEEAGKSLKNSEMIYTSKVNKKVSTNIKGCFELLDSGLDITGIRSNYKICADELFLKFVTWISAKREDSNSNRYAETFFRGYYQEKLRHIFYIENWKNDNQWSINKSNFSLVSLVDLALQFPQFKKLDSEVDRNIRFLDSQYKPKSSDLY